MNIKIYQINHERDYNRVRFCGLDELDQLFGRHDIDPSIYDKVFDADLEQTDLDYIYRLFNTAGHPLFHGASMSVSDIVVKDDGAYYVDTVGYEKIEFDESLTQKQDNLIRIVYVEPNKAPFVTEIPHELKAMQHAVGGYIESVRDEDIVVICNEEGRLFGLETNRTLPCGETIVGSFFVCGMGEEDFRSLTDDEVKKYMELFALPDRTPQAIALLEQKISTNYAEYKEKWLKMEPAELIERCEEVEAVTRMSEVLPSAVSESEAEYLLRFKNPLEVVSDKWISVNGKGALIAQDDMRHMLWDIVDNRSAEADYECEEAIVEEAEETEAEPEI